MTCNHFTRGFLCTREATHWLLHPDGSRNPGGWVCEEHGQATLNEYRQELGEVWGLVPLEEADGVPRGRARGIG